MERTVSGRDDVCLNHGFEQRSPQQHLKIPFFR
jgi:hypothetical protein